MSVHDLTGGLALRALGLSDPHRSEGDEGRSDR